MTDNSESDNESQELTVTTGDELLDELDEAEPTDLSETAQRVLIAAQMDLAMHGDETYDPERAAEAQEGGFGEEELTEACEELVDAGEFVREGDVYALSDL